MLAAVLLLATGTNSGLAFDRVDVDLRDDARGITLPIRVTSPREGGPYPVILLSHGFLGSRQGLTPLAEHWAANGFVVVQPTHEDSLQRKGQKIGFSKWRGRVDDVQFLLDHLEKLPFYDRMNRERIGMGGHSFGAHTSQLIGGMRLGFWSFLDPRPTSFLLISPQGMSRRIRPEAWADFTRPMMVITGSKDFTPDLVQTTVKQTPERRRDPFDQSPPGDKYLVWIDGAAHDFGGINGKQTYPGGGPQNPAHVDVVKRTSLAFWEATLKQNGKAKAFLNSRELGTETQGMATLSHR